jgi:hypothetical protein
MQPWQAGAAYFYILHLDRSALAWEYLRRNPEYRRQWRDGELVDLDAVWIRWGCSTAEDPDLDARLIQPTWIHEPPDVVRVTTSEADGAGHDHGFSLWALPGKQRVSVSDRYWACFTSGAGKDVQLRLDRSVEEGKPYAYVIRADHQIHERLKTLSLMIERLTYIGTTKRTVTDESLNRRAQTHARTLQAIDGVQSGASHRNIAAAIFGVAEIAKRWTPDSELRAQVRYLIRRGMKLINGGYRSLLTPVRGRRQGEMGD